MTYRGRHRLLCRVGLGRRVRACEAFAHWVAPADAGRQQARPYGGRDGRVVVGKRSVQWLVNG